MRSLLFLILSAGTAAAEKPVIEVFLPRLPQTVQPALRNAQMVVMAIYGEIGVRVRWRTAGSRPSGCETTRGHARILLVLADVAPDLRSNRVPMRTILTEATTDRWNSSLAARMSNTDELSLEHCWPRNAINAAGWQCGGRCISETRHQTGGPEAGRASNAARAS